MSTGVSLQEVLEHVKRGPDTDCGPQTMRRAYFAMKRGNWERFKEECRKEGKLCDWTFERNREAYEKVAMDDIGRLSIAQEPQRKRTDFLRRIIADERSHFVVCLLAPQLFPLDDYVWWVSGHGESNNRKEKHCNGVQHVEANTNGRRPTGYWRCSSVPMPMKRRCTKRMRHLWGFVTT